MKILITKDEHLQLGFRNKFRKPGWEDDVKLKHNFIINYMKENDIKLKVTTGDIFDKQTNWSFKQFIENKKILNMYKEAELDILSIAGNHDMVFGKETINGSVFEECVNENLLIYPKKTNNIITYNNINFIGIDYEYINEDNTKEMYLKKIQKILDTINNNNSNILIMHQNVTPESNRVTEFTYNELANEFIGKIDCFIFGHYHIGFPVQKINNMLFINPFNLWRVVRDYDVRENIHKPEFIILDTETMETESIEIPHRSYSDAFDLKEIESYKEIKKESFNFFNSINIDDNLDIDEISILDRISLKELGFNDISIERKEKIINELKSKFI